jgi:hypothetical protein
MDLLSVAEEEGLNVVDLEGAVVRAASRLASLVNQMGLGTQVHFLRELYGRVDALGIIIATKTIKDEVVTEAQRGS